MCYRLALLNVATLFQMVLGGVAAADLIDVTVNGGESLVLKFHQPGVPPVGTDTLAFTTGLSTPFAFDGSTYTLMEGPAILGSVDNTGTNLYARFTKTGSAAQSIAVNVDFASILAGTLVGRMIITPHGSARFIAPNIESYRATGDFGFELATHQALIIDEAFAAPTASLPEPTTASLLMLGLLGVSCSASRRGR